MVGIPLTKLNGTVQGSPTDLALNDLLFDFGEAGGCRAQAICAAAGSTSSC
jgi:hypothetical protein